jgi:hypothetical protein
VPFVRAKVSTMVFPCSRMPTPSTVGLKVDAPSMNRLPDSGTVNELVELR